MNTADPKARSSDASSRGEWAAGWPIVLMAFIAAFWMTTSAVPLGVLLKPIGRAWGWSRGATGLNVPIFSLILLAGGPVAGAAVGKFGPLRMALAGTLLSGITLFLIGRSGPNLTLWYLAWLLFGIAQLGCNFVVWAYAITTAFEKHRGAALAVAYSGTAVGSAVMPNLTLTLYKAHGIAGAFGGLGGLLLATSLPLLLWRHFRARNAAAGPGRVAVTPVAQAGLRLLQALRTARFWLLTLGFMVTAGVLGSITMHLQALMTDKGMSMETAAWVMSLLGPALLVGRLITGFMLDRFTAREIVVPVFAFPIVACFLLAKFTGAVGVAMLVVMFAGLAMGAEGDMLPYFVGRYFGRANFAPIYAVNFGLFAVGYGFLPVLAGYIYDLVGSYGATFLAFGVLMLAVTAAMLLLGAYPQEEGGTGA